MACFFTVSIIVLTLSIGCRVTLCRFISREKKSSLSLPFSCCFRTVPGSLVPAVACELFVNQITIFKTLLTFFNAARIKTFQPELPELVKTGCPCFCLIGGCSLICFCRAEGKSSFKIGEKALKGAAIVAASILYFLRLIHFRIPKMEERPCYL